MKSKALKRFAKGVERLAQDLARDAEEEEKKYPEVRLLVGHAQFTTDGVTVIRTARGIEITARWDGKDVGPLVRALSFCPLNSSIKIEGKKAVVHNVPPSRVLEIFPGEELSLNYVFD